MKKAVVVAGLLAVLAAAGWWLWTPHQDRDVAMPPDDASPSDVVAVYLDALDASDCATAEALWLSGASDGSTWCNELSSLTPVEVNDPRPEQPEWSGQPAGTEVVTVQVAFDLAWRPLRGDSSMEDGLQPWGYLLARNSATEPWRISGEGMG